MSVATIHLAPEQAQVLERWAEQEHKSVSALIQEIIAQQVAHRLDEEPQTDAKQNPLLDIIGIANTGLGDAALHHDRYLYGAGVHS